MKSIKKKSLLTAGVIAAFGLAILTSSSVFAQEGDKEMNTIVQKIAQKFNLKESEVQAVFEEEKKTRIAQMEEKYSARLDQLVSEGKITNAQKELILKKRQEMQKSMESDMESFKNQSNEERKSGVEKSKSELDSWAKENNIDPKYLKILFHHKGVGSTSHKYHRLNLNSL